MTNVQNQTNFAFLAIFQNNIANLSFISWKKKGYYRQKKCETTFA